MIFICIHCTCMSLCFSLVFPLHWISDATKIPKAIAPVRQRQLQQTSAWWFRKPRRWPWRETGTKSFRTRCLFNERTLWFWIFKVDFWNFLWCKFAAFSFAEKLDLSDISLGFNRTLRYFTQPIRSPKKGASNLPELLGCIPVGRLHDSLMIEWVSLAFCCPPPWKTLSCCVFPRLSSPTEPSAKLARFLGVFRKTWSTSLRKHNQSTFFWAPKSNQHLPLLSVKDGKT